MDTFFLLIIAVLLGFILYEIGRTFERNMHQPPLKYNPRKNSSMDSFSDVVAPYYTDMLYPVYGREIILITQLAYRAFSHKAFDLSWEARNANDADGKEKQAAYLIQEVNQKLAQKNLTIMMQANLDVLNGKLSIDEARRQTFDTVDLNNSVMPDRARQQIGIDIKAGVSRNIEDYLDADLLHAEKEKRRKQI